MQTIKSYLLETQPIVYQTLKNAFLNHKTSHAYIINGTKGSLVLPIAELIAQSLVCQQKQDDGLACETCLDCLKIKENNYIDYLFFNGEDLKNDQVLRIQKEFNKSAVEKQNIKIYIVHLIEKAPISSLNKLLKFIEEPNSNIVAIFTTNSLSSILPTITSRCQIVTLKQFGHKELVHKMVEQEIELEDANMMATMSNDVEANIALIHSSEYVQVKELLKESLRKLNDKGDYFIYYVQSNVLPVLDKINKTELYLDLLETCFFEIIFCKHQQREAKFLKEEISKMVSSCENVDQKILAVMLAKQELLSNANQQLVFDKLLITLNRR